MAPVDVSTLHLGWIIGWSLVLTIVNALVAMYAAGWRVGRDKQANEAQHKALEKAIDALAADVDEKVEAKARLLSASIASDVHHAQQSRRRLHERVEAATN